MPDQPCAPQHAATLPLAAWAGADIMLIDQVVRGRVMPGARVADVGCGGGRNLPPLLAAGHPVWGCDPNPDAIAACRECALAHGADPDRFRVEAAEDTSLSAASFDLVIVNAVLHFAADQAQFGAMTTAICDLLAPGGLLLARLATRDHWPAGAERGGFRYLASIDEVRAITAAHDLVLADPLRTSVTEGMRTMTTWVATRPA